MAAPCSRAESEKMRGAREIGRVSEQEGQVSARALQIDVHGDVVDMRESVGHAAADPYAWWPWLLLLPIQNFQYHLKHTTETPFSSPSIS
jgi:hypothetical protein